MASPRLTAGGEDRREDLEAAIWKSLQERPRLPLGEWERAHVETVMKAADAYAKAGRPRAPRKPRPAGPPKPPAVHYGPGGGQAECRPVTITARDWPVTGDSRDVNCGHCRKTPAWQEAAR